LQADAIGDDQAVRPGPERKLPERLDDLVFVPVAVKVLPLDVENAGNLRLEIVKAAVVLAGLDDENVAVPAAGGAAQLQDVGPHDEIGIDSGLSQAVRQPAAGGALAVRAADRDPIEVPEQLAEELGVFIDGTAPLAGQLQFGIVLADRRRDDDHFGGRVQVLRTVTDANASAQAVQAGRSFAGGLVGARHDGLLAEEEPGQAAHADAAGSDKMESSTCDPQPVHSLHDLIAMGRLDSPAVGAPPEQPRQDPHVNRHAVPGRHGRRGRSVKRSRPRPGGPLCGRAARRAQTRRTALGVPNLSLSHGILSSNRHP
jgi:hypothetical protein